MLYIHDPLFEKEKEKSKLVNNLLERHYHDTVEGGKTQEDVHREINKAVGWNVIDLGDDKQQGGQLKEVAEYGDLYLHSMKNKVWSAREQEYVEASKEMKDYLVRVGRVQ